MSGRRLQIWVLGGIFLLGMAGRTANVGRPVDRPSWREADVASIARNYAREDMRLLYPRIDWRGDGPGFAEMEFPLLPWLVGALYGLFGVQEVLARAVPLAFSIIALAVGMHLARSVLPSRAALAACLFLSLNPLAIRLGTSLQPDGLMIAAYLCGSFGFLQWLRSDSWIWYGLSAAAGALAILGKATAVHLLLAFAVWVFLFQGLQGFRRSRVWLLFLLILIPPLAWYVHAHRFWTEFGNSLGVSNEHHWIGVYVLQDPLILLGVFKTQALWVWMPWGVLVGILGARRYRKRRVTQVALAWTAACLALYFVAVRTAGADWAAYYHIGSVMPAALLFGQGVEAIASFSSPRASLRHAAAASLAVGVLIATVAGSGLAGALLRWAMRQAGFSPDRVNLSDVWLAIAGAACFLVAALVAWARSRSTGEGQQISGWLWLTGVLLVVTTYVSQIGLAVMWIRHPWWQGTELFACARQFAPALTQPGLMVASGGPCRDAATGFSYAYNASYMFYWLDRKGFNICVEEQSLERLETFALRGARYFVAEKAFTGLVPGFDSDLRARFPVLRSCPEADLFELTVKPTAQRVQLQQRAVH